MMTFKHRGKQGFTLIEIIIVVVILGILAAIALPKVTANIDKARAAEVFGMGSAVGKAFDRCLNDETGGARVPTAGDVAACNSLGLIKITPTSTNFTYTFSAAAASVLAVMNAQGAFSGNAATDLIEFTFDGSTGTVAKGCRGVFGKMCKN